MESDDVLGGAVSTVERWPGVRVLYMSGYTDNPVVRREAEDPAGAFLAKPFAPEALLAEHKRRPLSGVVVASPANPTGTMMTGEALTTLMAAADGAGIRFISDEIYHGLDYAFPAVTAAPFWVTVAFQAWVTRCPDGNRQPRFQPV